ncbi:MAG TPA: D-aminoacyl-tRNA deacylase [Cytophagaceae bacterium]|jgi:D-tyrosyl-tRNA(Tyr) deacylase|nr:D-aminoacyl-tRNA deacylase [Cytophagaceae bacterium]
MIALIQRVSEAGVTIEGKLKASIGIGLLVLIGIGLEDTEEDADWLCKKTTQMRIFGDEEGKMNLSLKDIQGDLLVISQFTLHASTKKGNRPSFIDAARPEQAIPLYEKFISLCKTELGKEIKTGEFGADMKVNLVNDGPVTIFLDSKNKK